MSKQTEIPESVISLLQSALRENAQCVVLVDFSPKYPTQGVVHFNIGDHPLELARFLERFARESRKEAKP